MARHPDFEKIHATFMQHYSKDPALGEARYAEWVKLSELDDSKGYYVQAAARAAKFGQSFEWAKFLLQFVREDQDARYYKVEALFPVESMNVDSPPFTRDEVLQSARSLTGKPSNLNHDARQELKGVEVVAAQFEDDCVECLVRVPKVSPLIGMIERQEIVSVSIEGEWSHGIPGFGLVLIGLAWLTKQSTLPGMPLTRIVPVERIVESFAVKAQVLEGLGSGHKPHGKFKLNVKELLEPLDSTALGCVFCGAPGEYLVSVCTSCGDNAQSHVNFGGVEKMDEKDMDIIAEKTASKVNEKLSQENKGLKENLSETERQLGEANTKVSEADGKVKAAESVRDSAKNELAAANMLLEKYRKIAPGVELLVDPPLLMPVSEALSMIREVLPPSMVQRSWGLGAQRMCQDLQRVTHKLEGRVK